MLRDVRIAPALIAATLACAPGLAPAQALAEAAAPPSRSQFPYLAPEAAPHFSAPPRRYLPPEGFSGYGWGMLRSAFSNLPAEAAAVRAAWVQRATHSP